MFEVGFTEIILILGIALVVLGPEKLPKVAADIGRWLGRARAMARQLKSQLDEEVVKADRNWSQPQPKKPSPKPAEPPPAAKPTAEERASGGETPADEAVPGGAPAADEAPASAAPAEPGQAGAQPDTGPKPTP
jgi:sec-independent protein translocase protein TatB